MSRSGCSVPAPCQKLSSGMPDAPRPSMRHPGVTRPQIGAAMQYQPESLPKANHPKAQSDKAVGEKDDLKDLMNSMTGGILQMQVDQHHCEDDLEVSEPAEAWEKELRNTLLEGAFAKQAEEHSCEDDFDVSGFDSFESSMGGVFASILEGAAVGVVRLSREDGVEVLDDEDLVVDVQMEQEEHERAQELVNPEDVDGILGKIFRKAMTSLREELCNEFGMEAGMEVFSDLDMDEEEFAGGEVFSTASEAVPELDEVEAEVPIGGPEAGGLHALQTELGVEAAALAEEALQSALGRLSELRTQEFAEDEFPSEADASEFLQLEAETALAQDLHMQNARVGHGLEQALHQEAAELSEQALFALACPVRSHVLAEDDLASLASDALLALDSESEDGCSTAMLAVDEALSDDENEEFEPDMERLQATLERALAVEVAVFAEKASGCSALPQAGKIAFLQDLEVLRARARDAILGFESANSMEEALDEAGCWDMGRGSSDLAELEEPDEEGLFDFLAESRMAFEQDVEAWQATCADKFEHDSSIEAAALASEEQCEHELIAPSLVAPYLEDALDGLSLASTADVCDADCLEELHSEMLFAMERDADLQLSVARRGLEQVLAESVSEAAPCNSSEACIYELAAAEAPILDDRFDSCRLKSQANFQMNEEAIEQAISMEFASLSEAEALERQLCRVQVSDNLEDVSGMDAPCEVERVDETCVADQSCHSLAKSLEQTLCREADELSQELSAALTLTCLKVPPAKPRSRQGLAVATRSQAQTPTTPSSPSQCAPSQTDSEGAASPQTSPQQAMVRTPSAAGRLRPHLRESIISFRLDDDSDEETQHQRESSISGLYETLGADVHYLDDPRISSRVASPAVIKRGPPSPAHGGCKRRAASPAMLSAPIAAPFMLSPQPVAAPFVLSPPATRSRGRIPAAVSMADQALKKSAKVRSASVGALKESVGALKEFQGKMSCSAGKAGRSVVGLRRSPSIAGF